MQGTEHASPHNEFLGWGLPMASKWACLLTLFALSCSFIPAHAQKQGKSGMTAKPAAKKVAIVIKPAAPKPAPFVATVLLRVSPEVNGQSFTLGEIADITGSDKVLVKQLSDLLIGTSPLPGMTRLLRPGDITLRLRGARLESPRVDVVAPPEMKVSRSKSDVASDEIVKAAQTVAIDAIKDLPDTSIEAVPPTVPTTLPKGKVTFLAGAVRGEPSVGKITVPVAIQVDGKPQQTVDITFTVRRRTKVLIATRVLEPNTILTMEDLAFAKIDLPSGFVRPAISLKEAVGKRVKAKVMADAPVSLNNLDTPPAVKFGDRVTIEFVIGAVRITAPGLVRGSGAIGETIRVHAPDTKKDIDAIVIDARTVRVPDLDAPTPELTEETEEPEENP
jgi:flagella basal body P-ring formation protein FlgA